MFIYYILILSLPMIDHPIFGKQIGGVTVEKILGALCFLYAFWELMKKGRVPHFLSTSQSRAFLIFYLLVLLAYVDAPGTDGFKMTIFTAHLVFMITTIILVSSAARLRWACLFLIASIDWASLYMLREWQTGSAIYGSSYRPGYVTGDPNYFTASVLLCLPMIFYFLSAEASAEGKRRTGEGLFYVVSICLILPAVRLGASRGGLVGMSAMALFIAWRSNRRIRNLIAIIAVGAALIFFAPSGPVQRLLHPTQGDKESSDIRLLLWQSGLNMIRSHPLAGVGLGRFKAVSLAYAPPGTTTPELKHIAHNTYLEMAAEIGVPGLLAFVAILFFTYRSAGLIRKEAQDQSDGVVFVTASSIQAGLVGFSISIFFISADFLKVLWFVVFLCCCLPHILRTTARGTVMVEVPRPSLETQNRQARYISTRMDQAMQKR
jgi:putative inorganic carbon (HCO3(-)) transporter